MNISDEAVELAAKAIFQQTHEGSWEDEPHYYRRQFIRNARAALEASTRQVAADAWERGEQYGYARPRGTTRTPNPYRS